MPSNTRLVFGLAALGLLVAVGCEEDAPPAPTSSETLIATAVASPSPVFTPTATPSPVPTVAVPLTMAPTVTSGATEYETDNLCHVKRPLLALDWIAPSTNGTVRWTPDGSLIFFDYGEILPLDGLPYVPELYAPIDTPDLYAVHADGSQLDRVVNVPSTDSGFGPGVSDTTFDLSPDGSRIVYAACALSYASTQGNGGARQVYNHEIFVSDVDGGNIMRLTTNTHFDVLPSWAPDGERIAFLSDTGRRHGRFRDAVIRLSIYTLATGRSREVEIATASTVDLNRLEWAPDGESIAFMALEGAHPWNLAVYVVGADGSGLSRVSDAASGPAWSPDGARIAMLVPGDEEDAPALYTFAADGSNPVELEHRLQFASYRIAGGWAGNLSWSPDGSAILFENVKDWDSGEGPMPLVVDVDRCPTADAGTGGRDAGISGIEARLVAVEVGGPHFGSLPIGHIASVGPSGAGVVFSIPQFARWSPDGSLIAVRNGGVLAPGHVEFELYVLDRSGNRSDLVRSIYTEEWQSSIVLVPDSARSGPDSTIRPETTDGWWRTSGPQRCAE